MQFDRHTIVLLARPPDAPQLSDQELDALQDAHLASQADLRTQGYLVAAAVGGPGRRAAARFGRFARGRQLIPAANPGRVAAQVELPSVMGREPRPGGRPSDGGHRGP